MLNFFGQNLKKMYFSSGIVNQVNNPETRAHTFFPRHADFCETYLKGFSQEKPASL
jgi:hypothetical protein